MFTLFVYNCTPFCDRKAPTKFHMGDKRIFRAEVYIKHALRILMNYPTVNTTDSIALIY